MPRLNQSDVLEGLKPYTFHGVELMNKQQATGDCPFCGKEGKFSVNAETSQFKCWSCQESGNATVFVQKLWELSDKATKNHEDLKNQRGFLDEMTLLHWEIVRSVITGEWLIPGYGADGTMRQLYKYVKTKERWTHFPTPGLGHQLHGMSLYDPKKSVVWLCEGWSDGICLWEVLSKTKMVGENFTQTASPASSLLGDCNVLATPSCSVFHASWLPLFAGKVVNLMYDSDHPKTNPKTGEKIHPAGYTGMLRVAEMLAEERDAPKEINLIKWGPEGYDPELPSGYDIRDALRGTLPERIAAFERLLEKVEPFDVPASEVAEKTSKNGELHCLPCTSYKTLVGSWKKAMKWTEGLDHGLVCMLSSVVSTLAIGDPLWFKIIAPASCLHGDTLVHDPVAQTTMTVRDRQKLGEPFHVYSLEEDGGVDIRVAMPPQELPSETMYRVTFASGRQLKVTGGHRMWDGERYVSVLEVACLLHPSEPYPLPTISEPDLSARMRGALRSSRTAGGCLVSCSACSCPCDGQLPQDGEGDRCAVPSSSGVQRQFSFDRSHTDGCGRTHRRRETGHSSSDEIVNVEVDGEDVYYDFHVPVTNNYWAEGFFHHNSGKTTIAEGVAVARQYVRATDTLRGFTSGYKMPDGTTRDLASELNGMTLITMDGDTLLQLPTLPNILSEARRLYDGSLNSHFKNATGKEVQDHRMTWLLLGTSALRQIDSSELGTRYLDCVMMDRIDDELEDEVLWRVVNRSDRNLSIQSNGKPETRRDPDMIVAMQMTGGYSAYLRQNAGELLSQVNGDDEAKRYVTRLGKFVAYMRARPSQKQDESVEREFAARLVSQLWRLAKCSAAVLNKREVDEEIVQRTKRVALDTARGQTLELVKIMYEAGDDGLESRALALRSACTDDKTRTLLRFLQRIEVAEHHQVTKEGFSKSPHWRLTKKLRKLYEEVMGE